MVKTHGHYKDSNHSQHNISQKLPHSMYNLEENCFTAHFRGTLTQRSCLIPQFMRGLSFRANIQNAEQEGETVRFVFVKNSQCVSTKVCSIFSHSTFIVLQNNFDLIRHNYVVFIVFIEQPLLHISPNAFKKYEFRRSIEKK